jgi:hypothetical protein
MGFWLFLKVFSGNIAARGFRWGELPDDSRTALFLSVRKGPMNFLHTRTTASPFG